MEQTQTTVNLSTDENQLALRVAIELYCYGDFSKEKNLKEFAKVCIYRGKQFAEAYGKYK